ncbi:hypothetical protein OOZ63_27305 [Paucibacter sp. PLA-PC-4]|uniref:hypothetical protein n=1 Tax=Paucibacter sp. PLA-PC-4 TaxID=2993655 RepID=UPI00224B58FE|nr:hypothetical protein [Paucibacter sp. PLA-PC-4]MCX2865535.1 hypothetical protein [Paucibacter sp. PLA-PC-4]
MGSTTFVRQPRAHASRSGSNSRERLTIDFRRHGPALTAVARSRRMSAAALARSVLGEWLDAQAVDASSVGAMGTVSAASVQLHEDAPFAKVTLRMPAARAAMLARAARAAELSQGMYVSQLLDAQASEDSLDSSPRALVSSLVRSNAKLAALNSGLKALGRALEQSSSPEAARLDALVAGLTAAVGQHLASVAPQIAAVPASWRRPVRKPDGE